MTNKSKGPGRKPQRVLKLPCYESMKQCLAMTGIPLRVMKAAKDSGCPGFRNSKVYLDQVLPWLFREGAQTAAGQLELIDDPKSRLVTANAALAEQKLMDRAKLTVNKSDVEVKHRTLFAELDSALARVYENELPPILAGLPALDIRTKSREARAEFWDGLRERFGQLKRELENNANQHNS